MEMGKGGAANGIQNSKLTINDDLGIYGLMFEERTIQQALVLPLNDRAKVLTNKEGPRITQFRAFQCLKLS